MWTGKKTLTLKILFNINNAHVLGKHSNMISDWIILARKKRLTTSIGFSWYRL